MEFFRWKPEKYKEATYHLTPYEDGCYRRLIDEYMTTRKPLPDNDAALARICGISLSDWMLHATSNVRAFFTSHNGLLHNEHCDEELDFQDARARFATEKAKKAAETRHNKNKNLDATSKQDECLALLDKRVKSKDISSKEDTPHTPRGGSIKEKLILPDWIDSQNWDDFVAHRKSIKKPLTEQAKKLSIQKLQKLKDLGSDPNESMRQTILNGWQGLFEVKDEHGGQKKTEAVHGPNLSLWRARVKSYKNGHQWLDSWPPIELCPKHILDEFNSK